MPAQTHTHTHAYATDSFTIFHPRVLTGPLPQSRMLAPLLIQLSCILAATTGLHHVSLLSLAPVTCVHMLRMALERKETAPLYPAWTYLAGLLHDCNPAGDERVSVRRV